MTNNNELERLDQIRNHLTDSETTVRVRMVVIETYVEAASQALEDMSRQVRELDAIITMMNEKSGTEEEDG